MKRFLENYKFYWRSLRYEWPRVKAWHKRHNPMTKKHFSWFEALNATVENPPCFDISWDEEIE